MRARGGNATQSRKITVIPHPLKSPFNLACRRKSLCMKTHRESSRRTGVSESSERQRRRRRYRMTIRNFRQVRCRWTGCVVYDGQTFSSFRIASRRERKALFAKFAIDHRWFSSLRLNLELFVNRVAKRSCPTTMRVSSSEERFGFSKSFQSFLTPPM